MSIKQRQQISESLKGNIRTEETRQKISATLTGRSTGPRTNETREKISESLKGRTQSAEHIAKKSAKLKGVQQSIATCPYCNKEGGISSMKRWHFDNCKDFKWKK